MRARLHGSKLTRMLVSVNDQLILLLAIAAIGAAWFIKLLR